MELLTCYYAFYIRILVDYSSTIYSSEGHKIVDSRILENDMK